MQIPMMSASSLLPALNNKMKDKKKVRGKKYQIVNLDERIKIIQAFEAGQNYMKVGISLGIKPTTVRSVIYRYMKDPDNFVSPKGGRRFVKLDQEMENALELYLEESPYLVGSMKTLTDRLADDFPNKPTVSSRCVAYHLNGQMYRIKASQFDPLLNNSTENKQNRYDYVSWYYKEGCHKHIIYIHYSGYNIWLRRGFGSKKENNVKDNVACVNRVRNLIAIVALSPVLGIVNSMVTFGAITSGKLCDFITKLQLSSNIMDNNTSNICGKKVCICFDVTAFPTSPLVLQYLSKNNLEFRALPPACPYLNPVEYIFVNMHKTLRSNLAMIKPLISHNRITFEEVNEHLHGCVDELVKKFTSEDCKIFFCQTEKYFPSCYNRCAITPQSLYFSDVADTKQLVKEIVSPSGANYSLPSSMPKLEMVDSDYSDSEDSNDFYNISDDSNLLNNDGIYINPSITSVTSQPENISSHQQVEQGVASNSGQDFPNPQNVFSPMAANDITTTYAHVCNTNKGFPSPQNAFLSKAEIDPTTTTSNVYGTKKELLILPNSYSPNVMHSIATTSSNICTPNKVSSQTLPHICNNMVINTTPVDPNSDESNNMFYHQTSTSPMSNSGTVNTTSSETKICDTNNKTLVLEQAQLIIMVWLDKSFIKEITFHEVRDEAQAFNCLNNTFAKTIIALANTLLTQKLIVIENWTDPLDKSKIKKNIFGISE